LVQLPLALLLGVVAVQLVSLCLSATDELCTVVAGGSGSDVKSLLAGITKGLVLAVGDPTIATFVLLLVGLLVAVAAFVLWLELLVRAAAVYVAVLFLPLVLAALVWPAVSQWCRRLVETLAALILSKFVIVATLSLAAGAVGSGSSNVASILGGGALLVLATFVPFSILRLIPVVEAGAIGHLDGVRQRGTAALTRGPRSAAQMALANARDKHGANKIAAETGPPGTGDEDPVPDVLRKMPGQEPGPDVLAHLNGDSKPKGPKPVLKSWPGMPTTRPAADGSEDEGDDGGGGGGDGSPSSGAPPGSSIIGKPGPYDRRYAIGRDEKGLTKLYGLPPLQTRPPRGPAGPAGPAATHGSAGSNGPDGAAGSEPS
jgi:hypothetical protein